MATQDPQITPVPGMKLTIRHDLDRPGAGVSGTVVFVGPRFASGDYLVTLELEKPVRWRDMLIRHIDVFMSELVQPAATEEQSARAVGE